MFYPFQAEEYIGDEPIAEHELRAVIEEDRTNDPGHLERLPDWHITEIEVLSLTGRWVRLPITHPLRELAIDILSCNRHRRAIENRWEAELMAA